MIDILANAVTKSSKVRLPKQPNTSHRSVLMIVRGGTG